MSSDNNLDVEYTTLQKLKDQCGIIGFNSKNEQQLQNDILLMILQCKYFLRDNPPHRQLFEQLMKIKNIKKEEKNT